MVIYPLQTATGLITAATSGTVVLPKVVNTSSAIIVATLCTPNTATINNPTDSQGNTYTTFGGSSSSTPATVVRVHWAKRVVGGSNTVTVTTSSTTGVIFVLEVPYLNYLTGSAALDPTSGGGSATGSGTSVTSSAVTTLQANTFEVAVSTNLSGATYSLVAGYTDVLNGNNGVTINAGLTYRTCLTPGSYGGSLTLSAAVNWASASYFFETLPSNTNNNYMFPRVGDGMSVSEKIR